MATQLSVPAHITRPFAGREIKAYHQRFDMSAWIMATGKEMLVLKGIAYPMDADAPPRQLVFILKQKRLQYTVDFIKCFWRVDLLAPKKT